MLTIIPATNPPVRGAEAGTGRQLPDPRCGEVWMVDFEDSIGTEIQKVRPAVVINMDEVRSYRLRVIVPVTKWQASRVRMEWHTPLAPSKSNGLKWDSSADAMNLRSVDEARFVRKLGRITAQELDDVRSAVMLLMVKQ